MNQGELMGVEEQLRAELEAIQECVEKLEQCLENRESELGELHAKVRWLECILSELRSSRSFKVSARMASFSRRLAPWGSKRRRLLRLAYRGVKAVPKLRNRQWIVGKVRDLLRSRQYVSEDPQAEPLESPWTQINEIRFPVFDRASISIIIPVYNHWHSTHACLRSIAEHANGLPIEVIVVDDGSSDKTREGLQTIAGLVSLRNEQNLGFIRSCNRAAEVARGEFLVFLNNDTVVTPGWLEALQQTFRDIPDAGYVGAKLIYPDGRLQEAGGVIWQDGSGWNYGKFDNPELPEYNYAREVDYCSGACTMVPRDLFFKLGGLDSRYAPAYYEDVDLAFKIHEAGHKVIYQPLARIIHHEGLTSGTSLDSGVKSYQWINQSTFLRRWSHRLAAHAPAPREGIDRNLYTRNVELFSRDRVLVIDVRLIMPDRDCGSLRMMEMIRAVLRKGHHVTFIPDHMHVFSPYLEDLQRIGVEVIHLPHFTSVRDYLMKHGAEFKLAIVSRADVAALHMTNLQTLRASGEGHIRHCGPSLPSGRAASPCEARRDAQGVDR